MIRTLIADDRPILREGLKHILADCDDIALAGEAADGHEVLARLRQEAFDILLLDMQMPGKSGVELIRQIKAELPRLPILVLSTHKEDLYAVRAIKAGAAGYLCKDNAAQCLLQAIRKVAQGGVYISPAVAEQLVLEMHPAKPNVTPHSLLSNREYQIFLLIAAGVGTTEIATRLNLSAKTVSTHKVRIKEKMGLANTSEFVRYAMEYGLLQ